MTQTESIQVQIVVDANPDDAFNIFTTEAHLWFRVTPRSFPDDADITSVRFEGTEGGRFIAEGSQVIELAQITAWEPGARLMMKDAEDTEVEVTFEAHGTQTQVTLVHRGLGSLTAERLDTAYRYGPRLYLAWFEGHVNPNSPHPVGVTPYVFYKDAQAMLTWLVDMLGFQERGRFIGTDGMVQNAELRVGATEVWVDGRNPDPWNGGDRPMQWIGVWVEDVDAIHQQLKANGVDVPEPENANYGVRSFNISDPEGCMWGFLARTDNQAGLSLRV